MNLEGRRLMNRSRTRLPGSPGNSQAGFTAIEVSAVATIIAIMALILIPIMRNRIDESKIVAAKDDMKAIETAQLVAYSYSSAYYRLQDLNRGTATLTADMTEAERTTEINDKIPPATWNTTLTDPQRAALANTWKGPYYAIHKSETVSNLLATFPQLFFGAQGEGGPLLVVTNEDTTREYPVDPWGGPYIFFGSGKIGAGSGESVELGIQFSAETNFSTAVVYSLGPDGAPGDGEQLIPENLFREAGILGSGDDIKREF